MKKTIFILIAIMLLSSPMFAQSLTHMRFTVSSGGGLSSDGIFTNQVVMGQTAFGESSDSLFSGGGGFLGGGDDWMTSIDDDILIPLKFELSQNYPNPFNPSTTIKYSLAEQANVRLEIYDILGRRVVVLVDEYQQAGKHSYLWNAVDIPSGVYFYRIKAGDNEKSRKMLLLK